MTNTAAASTNFLNGDSLSFWNGNDQSLGIGGLLWGELWADVQSIGGSILNLTNSSAELQGVGSYKVEQAASIRASDSISFVVTPLARGFDVHTRLIKATFIVMAALTAATTALNAAMTSELRAVNMNSDATSDTQESSLKKAMHHLYNEQIVATVSCHPRPGHVVLRYGRDASVPDRHKEIANWSVDRLGQKQHYAVEWWRK